MGRLLPLRLRALAPASGPAIPAAYFGMHINSLPATTIWGDYSSSAAAAYLRTPWPAIGIGTWRGWDSDGCNWRNIERSRGVYQWDRFDNAVGTAVAHGAAIIVNLGCGPDWATTAPGTTNPGTYVGYNPNPPANTTWWSEWCTALATRMVGLGARGAAYEIWNEVNDNSATPGTGFTGSAATLATLAQLAASAIKAVDPTAIMLSPNFTGHNGIVGAQGGGGVSMDAYITAGGMAFADVVAVHGYNTVAPWARPEGLISYSRTINRLLAANAISLPLWMTEWGWGLWLDSTGAQRSGGSGTAAPDPMPATLAAGYVTRMLLLAWLTGHQRMCFYAFDAFKWTSAALASSADHATLTPAGTAFAYARNLLTGGRLSGLQTCGGAGGQYYCAAFKTAAGRTGMVYWCDDYATVQASVPVPMEIRDNVGGAKSVSSILSLTGAPQFVFYT